MADHIRVNTLSLDRTRDNVNAQIQKIKTEIRNLYQNASDMNKMWEGEARMTFDAAFRGDIRNLENQVKNLEGIVNFETNASSEYNKCEVKVGSLVDSIKI